MNEGYIEVNGFCLYRVMQTTLQLMIVLLKYIYMMWQLIN